MPRFKQPGSALSRLSDRIGGGVAMPDIVESREAVSSITFSASYRPGDVILVFASNSGSITPPTLPTGFTAIATAAGSNTNLVSMIAGFRKITANESPAAIAATGSTRIAAVLLRGSKGVGQFRVSAPNSQGIIQEIGFSSTEAALAQEGSRLIGSMLSNNAFLANANNTLAANGIYPLTQMLATSVAKTVPNAIKNFGISLGGANEKRASITVEVLAA